MKICYVMTKNWSIHNKKFLDKFEEKNIDYVTLKVGLKTAGIDWVRLKYLLRKEKPDILHGGYIISSGFVSALSCYHPFLLMPWGTGEITYYGQKNFLYNRITHYTIKSADMVTCNAKYFKKKIVEFSNYPEDKIVVFPWGVNLKEYNPKIDGSEIREKLGWEDRKIMIMNRNFEPVYDHVTFIKGAARAIKNNKHIMILILGTGSTFSSVQKMVLDLGIEDHVRFIGRVPHNEMPKYLTASDVYVSTSLSDGTSTSLLEAMACGLPCVVTDVPTNLEWIKDGENGYIAPKENSKILADKILSLLEHKEKIKEFGKRNVKIARKRADWDKNFLELEKIYRKLIEK